VTTVDQFDFAPDTEIRTRVNGELTRRGTIGQMLRPISDLLSLVSRYCTLEPGTVILTGGPPLVSPECDPPPALRSGDRVTAEIDHLGELNILIE